MSVPETDARQTRPGDEAALCDAAAFLLLGRPTPELLARAGVFFGQPGLTEDVREAARDFADIFFSPVSGRFLPPIEGVFREGRTRGAPARTAAKAYALAGFDRAGLACDPLWRARLADDHLGVELAFVSALWRNHERDPRAGFDRQARAFRRDRLSPWLADYAKALGQAAESRLYRLLARLLETLV